MIRTLKTLMLPISMVGGIIFHEWIDFLGFIPPYLIFLMLIITYTRIKIKDLSITKFHITLLFVQLFGCWASYLLFLPLGSVVAIGAFICAYIPTATAAPVIAGMLGGNIPRLASYSLLNNLMVAVTAPIFLSLIDSSQHLQFNDSFLKICKEVLPTLLLPLLIAMLMRRFTPKLHNSIASHQSISFWLWAVALFIVVGRAVSFIINEPHNEIPTMLLLALASLIVCCMQFYIGRKIGLKYGDPISGAQGLGQKNTILGLWLVLAYLNPLASVAVAAYIIWQNIINSTQLYFKRKQI